MPRTKKQSKVDFSIEALIQKMTKEDIAILEGMFAKAEEPKEEEVKPVTTKGDPLQEASAPSSLQNIEQQLADLEF